MRTRPQSAEAAHNIGEVCPADSVTSMNRVLPTSIFPTSQSDGGEMAGSVGSRLAELVTRQLQLVIGAG